MESNFVTSDMRLRHRRAIN